MAAPTNKEFDIRGVNHLDNVEVLEIDGPAPRSLILVVEGSQVRRGPQRFWAAATEGSLLAPVVARSYRLGDANTSGRVDISDAINTLSFLFTGGATPQCLKAADTDDSGEIDITDAINTLGFLFTGGKAPRTPFPDCGLDPSDDALPCETQPACR